MAPPSTRKARAQELQTLIESMPSTNVKKQLLEVLADLSTPQLKVLLEVFALTQASSRVEKHCVRCHDIFYDHTNGPRECKIKHGSLGDRDRTKNGDDTITMTLYCCGIEYDMEKGLPRGSLCYVAPHTTDSTEVEYFDEEENWDETGNSNVVTCEERGCAKLKRKALFQEDVGTSKKQNVRPQGHNVKF